MKGKLETWKGVVESKGLRINVNKTKIVIINCCYYFFQMHSFSTSENIRKP